MQSHKQVPEDTLHYTIHLPGSLDPHSHATLISAHVTSLLPPAWIWHKDSWQLGVVPEVDAEDRRRRFGEVVGKVVDGQDEEDEGDKGRALSGTMRVGDAVDDEWVVVWLLRQVSLKYPELIISIRDTDGEFLLIEAADHLPRWLTPDNAENRFWLAKGHFHLIPPTYKSSSARPRAFFREQEDDDTEEPVESDLWISERDAVRTLTRSLDQGNPEFRVSDALENCILARINSYPEALATHHQHTIAYLPVNIAKALRFNPALVQRAVEGFYMRDPAQLRAAARTTRFPPAPATSVVRVPVTMTRVAYAQLKGQIFHPPRTFGAEWRVPPLTDDEAGKLNAEERTRREEETRARDLGVKIVMGFEIMYREDNKRAKGDKTSVDERDPAYVKYLDNLQRAGFFSDEMEGSEGWTRRMGDAREGWLRVRGDTEARTSFADAVDTALKATMSLDVSELTVPPTYTQDSESWLDISPDELDGLLSRSGETRPAPAAARGEDAEAEAQAETLSVLARKVGQFVEGEGDLDGARFEDELSDEGSDFLDSDDESDAERSMQVDPMTDAEKEARLQALVPGLKPDEWGAQTQETSTLSSRADGKKAVSFAEGSASAKADEEADAALEKARKPRFEPTDYEGHVVESGDETDEEDGEQTMPGWRAKPTRQKKKGPIDPAIYQLSEALKTGKVGPIEGWKDRSEQEDLEMSDAEDDEDVVEGDIDMEQEEEEFLKFARDALGIDEAMWTGMLEERKSRGAYIPGDRIEESAKPTRAKEQKPEKPAESTSAPAPAASPFRAPAASAERNPDLDSFEKVMEAMEAELARAKAHSGQTVPTPPPKTKAKDTTKPGARSSATANPLPSLPSEADLDAMDEDDLIAMDRELRAALKSAGISDDEDYGSDEDMDDETRAGLQGLTEDAKGEFKMMKDFLESYKAQGGQSGVVGNLFGRLGGK